MSPPKHPRTRKPLPLALLTRSWIERTRGERSRTRKPLALALLTLFVAGWWACIPKLPCLLDKDCQPTQRCVSGICRASCTQDRDCTQGLYCHLPTKSCQEPRWATESTKENSPTEKINPEHLPEHPGEHPPETPSERPDQKTPETPRERPHTPESPPDTTPYQPNICRANKLPKSLIHEYKDINIRFWALDFNRSARYLALATTGGSLIWKLNATPTLYTETNTNPKTYEVKTIAFVTPKDAKDIRLTHPVPQATGVPRMKIWSLPENTGKPPIQGLTFAGHSDEIKLLRTTKFDALFAVTTSGKVWRWELNTRKGTEHGALKSGEVTQIAFSQSAPQPLMLVGTNGKDLLERHLELWRAVVQKGWERLYVSNGFFFRPDDLDWESTSPSEFVVVAVSLSLFRFDSKGQLQNQKTLIQGNIVPNKYPQVLVRAVRFFPTGGFMVASVLTKTDAKTSKEELHFLHATTHKLLLKLPTPKNTEITQLQWSPNGAYLAGLSTHSLFIWGCP